MSELRFGIVPEEALLDKRITLGAIRVLHAIWSFCLRDGNIVWSDFLTSSQIARAAGIRPGNLAKVLRELAHLEYIVIGPRIVNGIHSLRPHQRFGEKGPSIQEIEKAFRSTSREARGPHSSGKTIPPDSQGSLTTAVNTTDSESRRRGSSNIASSEVRRKGFGQHPKETPMPLVPWTTIQQGILELLAENGMEGGVPMQVALIEGMTFRRVALLVADGIAKGQSTGLLLTRLKGKDMPPKGCPLCGAKKEHCGFADGDAEMNCPLYDCPDMTDEHLVISWRRVRGMSRLPYWNALETEAEP